MTFLIKSYNYVHLKKLTAIALIVVFLFNVIGYYGIYMVMLHQANVAMDEKIIHDQFNENQTVTIKVPLTLPYPSANESYERAEGDFEYQGEFYKLVKQKHAKDTLYLICVKSVEEKHAFQIFSDLVKLSTDQTPSTHNQNSKTIVSFIKDYNPVLEKISLTPRHGIDVGKLFSWVESSIASLDMPVFSPPPEV